VYDRRMQTMLVDLSILLEVSGGKQSGFTFQL
jgi:hypothetical protein